MTIGTMTFSDMTGDKPKAPMFAVDVSFPGDDNYPAGGTPDFNELVRDAIDTHMKALPDANVRGRMNVSVVSVAGSDSGQYVPSYDAVNDKLFVRDGGSATWAEASGDLKAITFKLTLLCK